MTDAVTPTQRSSFVTGVAWTFIGLAAFGTLIALMQNVMLSFMLPPDSPMRGAENLPAFAQFMFSHPRMIFAAFLAVSATTLVSAIGLLKRKNWARLIFIGIMVLGVVWNIGSLILPFYMFSALMPPMPESTPQDFRESFEMTWKIMTAFTIVIALAFAVLFAWITKRLASQDVKREFLAL